MLDELKKKRNALFAELSALGKRAADWTEDENAAFDAKDIELAELDKRIAKVETTLARGQQPIGTPLPGVNNPDTTLGRVEVGEDLEAAKPFATFGEQLLAIKLAAMHPASVDKRLVRLNASGSNTVIDSDGGYAVQQDFAGELMTRAIDEDDIASRCTRMSVNGNGLKFYRPKVNTDANNAIFGGIRVYRAAEAATVEASKPELEEAEVRLEKLMGLWYVTDEASQDAAALSGIARVGFSQAMSATLSDEIINGTGAGRCLGILNSNVLVSVAKETNQAAATIVYDNVRKMKNRVLPGSSYRNAVVFVNIDAPEQLEQMAFPVGTGGVPVFLPAGGVSVDGYNALYGKPVIPSTHCPALGSVGDILFADFSRYLLIDKAGQGVKEDVSMHVRFLYGENTYRWTWRINGMPIDSSPFTFKNSTLARSPFVALAARA
jgi:HK97 family phage major capsid protein